MRHAGCGECVPNAALRAEPAPGGKCRVCGTELPDGRLVCGHCGAVHGEAHRCPHCGSVADVEAHGRLRARCRVCGGPRVPADDEGSVRSGREIAVLERARRAALARSAWVAGAAVVGMLGLLSTVIVALTLLIASPGLAASLTAAAVAALPMVVAALAWRRASLLGTEVEGAVDEAWTLVASDVVNARGEGMTAGELARRLRTDEAHAEALLARLNARDAVRVRVTDEGELVYSGPDTRRRVVANEEIEEVEEAVEEEKAMHRAVLSKLDDPS